MSTWKNAINGRGDDEKEHFCPKLVAVKEGEVHKEEGEGGTGHALNE